MNFNYSNFKNVQILIALLKKHGIRKIVASPGTSNMPFVASVQQDDFFEIYSCVDERSAAYIACGLSVESGEPVVITCTGATASRNYMSGLTEAYYRKIPILAVTATQDIGRLGQNAPQLIDRRVIPNDIAKYSVHLPVFASKTDEVNYAVLINTAILELTRHGGGPVHINLTIPNGRKKYDVKELPNVDAIRRISMLDTFPSEPSGRIAIYVGAHRVWNARLTTAIETFCEKYNAVVLVDHISNYRGKYAVFSNIVTFQEQPVSSLMQMDYLLHIGDIEGSDFPEFRFTKAWRINPDGEVRSRFGKLEYVFEMEEYVFFEYYNGKKEIKGDDSYLRQWQFAIAQVRGRIPELPLSNVWVAQNTIDRLPDNVVIHFAIQNSLRCWNFFEGKKSLQAYCNTGGFGIDGNVSSLIGASLVHRDKLYYGIIGDLAFFYDMNSLGNRHVGNNLRIVLINNNGGQQFRNHDSSGYQFGQDVNKYMAAAGHHRGENLVRDYAENLGFEYMCAFSQKEYLEQVDRFCIKKLTDKPMLFEVFIKEADETNAMHAITSINKDESIKHKAKSALSSVLGEETVEKLIEIVRGE